MLPKVSCIQDRASKLGQATEKLKFKSAARKGEVRKDTLDVVVAYSGSACTRTQGSPLETPEPHNPYYRDPRRGTANVGKPSFTCPEDIGAEAPTAELLACRGNSRSICWEDIREYMSYNQNFMHNSMDMGSLLEIKTY